MPAKIQHSTKKQYVIKVMLTSAVVSEFISVKVCCISGHKTKDFFLCYVTSDRNIFHQRQVHTHHFEKFKWIWCNASIQDHAIYRFQSIHFNSIHNLQFFQLYI